MTVTKEAVGAKYDIEFFLNLTMSYNQALVYKCLDFLSNRVNQFNIDVFTPYNVILNLKSDFRLTEFRENQ